MLKLSSLLFSYQSKLFNKKSLLHLEYHFSTKREAKIDRIIAEKKKQSNLKYQQRKIIEKKQQEKFVKVRKIPDLLQPHFYFDQVTAIQKLKCSSQQQLLQVLQKHNNNLQRLSALKYSQKQFQRIWTKYSFYVVSVFENVVNKLQSPYSNQTVKQLLRYFVSITDIHQKFPQIRSQNLTKTMNRIAHILVSAFNDSDLTENLTFISACSKYHQKKAKAILIAKRKTITENISNINEISKQNPHIPLLFLKIMKQLDYHNNLFLERSLDSLYSHINFLNSRELTNLLYYLGSSQNFINKTFFLRVVFRLIKLIKSNSISDQDLFRCASSISLIEKNMSSVVLNELQTFYQFFISEFCKKVETMWSRQLATFANIIRRAKIYHPLAIQALIQQCLNRQIMDFQSNSQQIQIFSESEHSNPILQAKRKIQLECLLITMHMLATLNHRSEKFTQYVLEIIQLSFCQEKKKWISFELASRTIWSACILCTPEQVSKLFPMIQYYFQERAYLPTQLKNEQGKQNNIQKTPSTYESLNYYYSYLYLKTFFPKITLYNQALKRLFSDDQIIKSKISKFHEEIYSTLISCGIPCIKQFNIKNLMVDILIPQYEGMNNIVIEVHGFQHFLRDFSNQQLHKIPSYRNLLKLDGSSILKKKLIENEGYWYYFISLDEWNLLEKQNDQKQFISMLMDKIKSKYDRKLQNLVDSTNAPKGRKTRKVLFQLTKK